MKTSTRRSIGLALIVISLLAVLALYLSGTPLLSQTSWQKTTSSAHGSMTVAVTFGEIHVRWPFLVVGATALLGVVAIVWPQRRPPRL
jgi:hypothetical protein